MKIAVIAYVIYQFKLEKRYKFLYLTLNISDLFGTKIYFYICIGRLFSDRPLSSSPQARLFPLIRDSYRKSDKWYCQMIYLAL